MKERVFAKWFYVVLLLLLIIDIAYSNNTGAWITWPLKPPSVTPPVLALICREARGSCLANSPPWEDSHSPAWEGSHNPHRKDSPSPHSEDSQSPWEDCPSWRLSSEHCWCPQSLSWIPVAVSAYTGGRSNAEFKHVRCWCGISWMPAGTNPYSECMAFLGLCWDGEKEHVYGRDAIKSSTRKNL